MCLPSLLIGYNNLNQAAGDVYQIISSVGIEDKFLSVQSMHVSQYFTQTLQTFQVPLSLEDYWTDACALHEPVCRGTGDGRKFCLGRQSIIINRV